ncbi:hypothetical protein HMPREF0348_0015 [Enterococcus faecalis TX0104]|nr:hypothetical protein HMPREF0348_0015 [Enterococcus faecalis TX0104]DAE44919.1 MAG TPA: hypothetical protein [Caudoviricetes sp.]DAI89733.1 MAG TPA: hypothetical protein [Caudoviricetes sp.]
MKSQIHPVSFLRLSLHCSKSTPSLLEHSIFIKIFDIFKFVYSIFKCINFQKLV